MKKLFFALALLLLTANGAFAATCSPDTDQWDINGFCVNNAGTMIPKSTGGYQVPVITTLTGNTATTLTIAQSGSVINDTGGVTSDTLIGYGSKYTLPRAAVGLTYTLTVGSKSTATLDTIDTADTFLYSISGTGFQMGDSMKSTGQAGDSVTVTCTKAGQWSIAAMKSAWTNNSTN